MKKLLSSFFLLSLFVPFFKVAQANEYKFLKGYVENHSMPFDHNVFAIYGVTLTGESTFLQSFQGIDDYMTTSWEDGHVDEFEGKLFIDAREHNTYNSGSNTYGAPTSEYLLEYDFQIYRHHVQLLNHDLMNKH